MKKHPSIADSDVTQERYQGPSYATTIAGEAGITHFMTLAVGIVAGGISGFVFHKQVGGAIRSSREWLGGLKESPKLFTSFFGSVADKVMASGEGFVTLCKKSEKFSKWLEKRDANAVAAAIDGAILTGGAGFIGGLFLGGGTGAATARRGREQFERAKAQIREERAINADLREKYAAVRAELETAKAPEKHLTVASDDTPAPPASTPTMATAGPDMPVKIEHRDTPHAAQHAPAHPSHAEKIAAAKEQATEAARG